MRLLFCFILTFTTLTGFAQQDSAKLKMGANHSLDTVFKKPSVVNTYRAADTIRVDTSAKKTALKKPPHDPHKATLRSAILPGWGQIYNREYWKLPIVYAAIGIPIGIYVYNNTWYKRTRDAYIIVVNNDSADFDKINPLLKYQGYPIDAASLQTYRNEFRQDRDYSLLAILLAWSLNIVDATVFGNLKDFDVSDDLSMRVHLNSDYNPLLNSKTVGLSFTFDKPKPKPLNTTW